MKTCSGCLGWLAWVITGLVGMVVFSYLSFSLGIGLWALVIAIPVMWIVLTFLENAIASLFMFFARQAVASRKDAETCGSLWREACNHSLDVSGTSFETHIK